MAQLEEDGVELLLGAVPKLFQKMCEPETENGFPTIQVVLDHQGEERTIDVDAVLFAVGR